MPKKMIVSRKQVAKPKAKLTLVKGRSYFVDGLYRVYLGETQTVGLFRRAQNIGWYHVTPHHPPEYISLHKTRRARGK